MWFAVTHPHCDFEDCQTRPHYGLPGLKQTRCALHKAVGMIKYSRRICNIEGCKDIALFGDTTHLRCEKHKLHKDNNFIERECISCKYLYILNEDNKCYNCSEYKNYYQRIFLQKQKRIKSLVEMNYKILYYDKVIDASCNLKRPDIVIDCDSYFLIIEVDENQHNRYQKECEEPRMNMITQSLGMPTFWIRYNPDDYKDENNIKSDITNSERENLLMKWIEKCSKTPPKDEKEFVRVCFLFYNGFNKNSKFNYEVVDGLI